MPTNISAQQLAVLQSLGLSPPQKATKPQHKTSNLTIYVVPFFLACLVFLLLVFSKTAVDKPRLQTARDTTHHTTPTPAFSTTQLLIRSETSFTQAIQSQANHASMLEVTGQLNEAISLATQAIVIAPHNSLGWEQRGKIYAALQSDSQLYIDQALADLEKAYTLTPKAETSRLLASLWAKKGVVAKTIYFLGQTVLLEPTKAQNLYDLARLQTQTGNLKAAVQTYQTLIPLIPDPSEQTKLTQEKTALEELLAQNPKSHDPSPSTNPNSIAPTHIPYTDSPLLEAKDTAGLLVASPHQDQAPISVTGQSQSNALSGVGTIPKGQQTVTIPNSNLHTDSHIYLSVRSGPKHQKPYLAAKSGSADGGTFTVSVTQPATEDVVFNWWLTN